MNADDPVQHLVSAYKAAITADFKLFFSFDYAGNGPWEKETVTKLLKSFSPLSSYYRYRSKPLASTFEGPGNSNDWVSIKKDTGCFFIPDWSSLGAQAALELGTADGLFSWLAWPWANTDMDTFSDASYKQSLGEKPYMMPVSPWFYTNLPGYNKNWLWRGKSLWSTIYIFLSYSLFSGDDLWRDRWEQVMVVQPDLVQIISWNDYGESHYIGPLREEGYRPFEIGKAPYNYALNMPHDGWRQLLPYWIDTYKHGKANITEETLVAWYRPHPASACRSGNTTGNTASQLQLEFEPAKVVQDRIFFSALLTSEATVTVTVGGKAVDARWDDKPSGDIGVFHGSAPYKNALGDVKVVLSRNGSTIVEVDGRSITTTCTENISNYNAWVGSNSGSTISATTPDLPISKQKCIKGTSKGDFKIICEFTCKYGYCPLGACVCKALGSPPKLPKLTGNKGYSANGDPNFSGLCDFSCKYGFCPSGACSPVSVPTKVPKVSPFLPPACTSGTGKGKLDDLCKFSCKYGFCPIGSCDCTTKGVLAEAPPVDSTRTGYSIVGEDNGLCNFACQRGHCPKSLCETR